MNIDEAIDIAADVSCETSEVILVVGRADGYQIISEKDYSSDCGKVVASFYGGCVTT